MTPFLLWYIRNVWKTGRLKACVNLTLIAILLDVTIAVRLLT